MKLNLEFSDKLRDTRLFVDGVEGGVYVNTDTELQTDIRSAPVKLDKHQAITLGWFLLKIGFKMFLKKNPKAARVIEEYGPPSPEIPNGTKHF
jgi:hypothetical protein